LPASRPSTVIVIASASLAVIIRIIRIPRSKQKHACIQRRFRWNLVEPRMGWVLKGPTDWHRPLHEAGMNVRARNTTFFKLVAASVSLSNGSQPGHPKQCRDGAAPCRTSAEDVVICRFRL
jgi:hypothetical protein